MIAFYMDACFFPVYVNIKMARVIFSPVTKASQDEKKKVALVACVRQKKDGIHPARELFTSAWFVKAKEYVENGEFDDWYILSAKYHLVSPTEEIESYSEHLNQYKKDQVQSWAKETAKQIEQQELSKEKIYILGSEKYRSIRDFLPDAEIIEPFKHMGISKQMAWMHQQLEETDGVRDAF